MYVMLVEVFLFLIVKACRSRQNWLSIMKFFRFNVWLPEDEDVDTEACSDNHDSIRDHRNCVLISELFRIKVIKSSRVNFAFGMSPNIIPVC